MPPFRIAITGDFLDTAGASAYGDVGWALLQSEPRVRFHFLHEHAPKLNDAIYWERFYAMTVTAEQIQDIDGLIVLRPKVNRTTFERGAGDLVVIGRSGAGYDKIDLAACTDNDVALFNAPLALNHATASTALLFMLALAKKLPQQERITRAGRWDLQAVTMGSELEGRTLGIIGLGHSGRELVRLVTPFHMKLVAFSPHADPQQASGLGVRLTTLHEVLQEADYLSLHCRLCAETRGLIGVSQLALMKPTAYFINVARGELVDEPALVAALYSGWLAGAALDVFAVEPLPRNHPLLELDNVIVTPHWSASTTDVWRATGQAMAAGMLRAARGQVPEHVVNVEVLNRPGFQAKLRRFAPTQVAT